MANRVLDAFEVLMHRIREGTNQEGKWMTFEEMMAFRKLAALEKELLGQLIDVEKPKGLESHTKQIACEDDGFPLSSPMV